MSKIPWLLTIRTPFKARESWESIRAQVNKMARDRGVATYDENPTAYRFEGWGTVGLPPQIACNVKYFDVIGPQDWGRFVAFEKR